MNRSSPSSPPTPVTALPHLKAPHQINDVLRELKTVYENPQIKSIKSLEEVGLASTYIQVENKDVLGEVRDMLERFKNCIRQRVNISFVVPSQAAKYQVYLKSINRFALKHRDTQCFNRKMNNAKTGEDFGDS
ncbi:hypothetical protein QL285_077074 [Trifolium repens]|nr:hypothetical protein QL285_077074 [Trifolium repens]